jgi:hypothetical protein
MEENMKREVITKLDAARRQLEVAIQLYFDNGDVVSTHTLAGAAREVFEKYCKINNRSRLFDDIQKRYPDVPEKELWNVLNDARNFFKHVNPQSLNDTIEIGQDENKLMIFMAAHDCGFFMDDDTPALFQRYITWFIGTEPFYRQHHPELDDIFPRLHLVSEEIQLEIGKAFVMLVLPDGTKIDAKKANSP